MEYKETKQEQNKILNKVYGSTGREWESKTILDILKKHKKGFKKHQLVDKKKQRDSRKTRDALSGKQKRAQKNPTKAKKFIKVFIKNNF